VIPAPIINIQRKFREFHSPDVNTLDSFDRSQNSLLTMSRQNFNLKIFKFRNVLPNWDKLCGKNDDIFSSFRLPEWKTWKTFLNLNILFWNKEIYISHLFLSINGKIIFLSPKIRTRKPNSIDNISIRGKGSCAHISILWR